MTLAAPFERTRRDPQAGERRLDVSPATQHADRRSRRPVSRTASSRTWGRIEAQLQLLEQNRKANIISNPRITTVDNREAKILVGQKIPLIVQDVAGNPVSQLQTIGIQLK